MSEQIIAIMRYNKETEETVTEFSGPSVNIDVESDSKFLTVYTDEKNGQLWSFGISRELIEQLKKTSDATPFVS